MILFYVLLMNTVCIHILTLSFLMNTHGVTISSLVNTCGVAYFLPGDRGTPGTITQP